MAFSLLLHYSNISAEEVWALTPKVQGSQGPNEQLRTENGLALELAGEDSLLGGDSSL